MRLLIWGISNIGKTTIGRELAKKIKCKFYDIDEIIMELYGSIDDFQEFFPNDYDRFDEKEMLMQEIIDNDKDNFIMAVSPIYSTSNAESILDTDTVSIELIDTVEAIYDRIIFDGKEDLEYKEKHREYYMNQIKWDQTASYQQFKNIPKVDISNLNVEESVETIYNYLKDNKLL